MKKIISSTAIIAPIVKDGRAFEVCATAEGNFDERQSQLVLELDSLIRPVGRFPGKPLLEEQWLPHKQKVTESVSVDDASDLAREIFHRWSRTVRQAIPCPGNN
jgi:hypothetical protein